MTLALSPSTTIFKKPASTANSKAFLQAIVSTSSLQVIAGPMVDNAAITSTCSFRITAPKPELLLSLKMVASKFNLTSDWGGERHTFPIDCLGGTDGCSYACLNSSKYSAARLFNHPGSLSFPPCSTLFLWFQIIQAYNKNNSTSFRSSLSIRYSNSCNMSCWPSEHLCNLIRLLPTHPELQDIPIMHVSCLRKLSSDWANIITRNFSF